MVIDVTNLRLNFKQINEKTSKIYQILAPNWHQKKVTIFEVVTY